MRVYWRFHRGRFLLLSTIPSQLTRVFQAAQFALAVFIGKALSNRVLSRQEAYRCYFVSLATFRTQ